MSRSSPAMLGGLIQTGKVETPYAISMARAATLRVRVNMQQGDTGTSGSKMPTPFNNLSILAVLDTDGVVHFYTVTDLADLKPLGGPRGKKGPGTASGEDKIISECMSFSLEHEHVRSYDNVNSANIRIVDMQMDTSEYSRIILVSVDELGGIHTTVIGYQVFKGTTFIGQILPVDAQSFRPEIKKKVRKSEAGADSDSDSDSALARQTVEADINVNGEAEAEAEAEAETGSDVAAVDAKGGPVVEEAASPEVNTDRSDDSPAAVRRSEASVLTGEFDKNIARYGTSPNRVNVVWGGAVSKKAAVPVELLALSAEESNSMRPVSLLVLSNSLNSTRTTLADSNRTNHIYAVGLSTPSGAEVGRSYPILAFVQPNGAVLHSVSADATADLGGHADIAGAPFGMLDLAAVPSDSMVIGISPSSVHLISTKTFTADARERRSQSFAEDAQSAWSFGIHECSTRDADDSAEFYIMRQGGFRELVSVRVASSRVLVLSIRMASGVVNLYHLRYDSVLAPPSSPDSGPGPEIGRNYGFYYMGSVDPPYLPVGLKAATTDNAAALPPPFSASSRLALFNFDQGKRSQLLLSSEDSCSVGLFNISSPIKADSSDDIVAFRRNFAPSCYRAEIHGDGGSGTTRGNSLLSGVEIFSSTAISSSPVTSGTKGGVSHAHLAPRKSATTASISKRRKPKPGGSGGGMTGGQTSKITTQSLPNSYNNLLVAYNHYNCTSGSGGCDTAVLTGRVLFYEPVHHVNAQSSEEMAGLMKYGMYGVVIVAAILIRLILKGFGDRNSSKSTRASRAAGRLGSKKFGKGNLTSTKANDDSGDEGISGRYNKVKEGGKGKGEMQELIDRASTLQKLIDDAEQEVYRKKSAHRRGLGANSTYPTGVGNSAFAGKLRSELYDEPHKYQLSD